MKILKSNFVILVSVLITASPGFLLAQNFKRGYKLLEKNDFEKAQEIFVKVLEDEPENVSSHFGMALLYSNDDFPQKDYLKAWEYADYTNKNNDKFTDEELEVLTEYYVNTEERRSSRPVKKKIEISLDLILDKLVRQIRESNDVELVKNVLERFPDFEYYDNTVHIRNYLEYRAVEKQNTIEGYNQFISNFPDAAQVPLAVEKRNKLIFENVKTKNSLAAYNEFIHNYPESEYVSEAVKLRNKVAFGNAKQANSVEAIETFINSYPDALEVLDAKIIQKQLIYERAKKIRSLEAYDEFIAKYPEGVQYVDIFNLKAKEMGEKLLQRNKYPTQSFQWARVFDNANKYDEAADLLVDNVTGEIILACNTCEDSIKMMNAWVIGLKNNGEMAWNKQIGDNLNDRVNKVKLVGDKLYFTGLTRGVNDSIVGEPWVFTLQKNGAKVWNRTYSIPSIEAFDITKENEIIFGSFYGDTIKKYYLTKLTSELKRLWKREYSNDGVISSVSVLSNSDIVVGGNNWLFKIDNNGYLKWENYLQDSDSVVVTASNTNYVCIAGIRDSLSLFITMYDLNGGRIWDKSFIFEDGIELASIKLDNVGNVYFAGTSASDGVIITLDSKGSILNNLMFGTVNKVTFKSLYITPENKVYILANEFLDFAGISDVILLQYLP